MLAASCLSADDGDGWPTAADDGDGWPTTADDGDGWPTAADDGDRSDEPTAAAAATDVVGCDTEDWELKWLGDVLARE